MSVMDYDWNYLIVLDAMRYDYFEEHCPCKYIDRLRKVTSVGSSTIEWAKKSFTKHYPDILYLSANPFINSKRAILGFFGKDHFETINLWDKCWDDELNVVPPWTVAKSGLSAAKVYPNKRLIMHFMQPHVPYIGSSAPTLDFDHKQYALNSADDKKFKLYMRLSPAIRLVSKEIIWRLRKLTGRKPTGWMEATYAVGGKQLIRKCYHENVQMVMNEAIYLAEQLPGKTIVTADHGELLGEHGLYGHTPGAKYKELREVPLLEIDKGD